jgi:hypothetical protein
VSSSNVCPVRVNSYFFLNLNFLVNFDFFFQVGDRVVCKCDVWREGTVIALKYREQSWPLDRPDAPYQVELLDGGL